MGWARHRRAPWYLASLSFAESSFFPIPPDVMLAPMVLGRPRSAWSYAALTTIASVLGGAFGYLIGLYLFEAVEPLLHRFGYWDDFQLAQSWFDRWGFWVILLAGFTPIPYKVFTITAGTVHMGLLPFVLGSLIGRGGRFFLVSGLIRLGGERLEKRLRANIDRLGWIALVVAGVAYALYYYWG
jgi:membrane protein YqaA with SNARE-associated domain